MLSSVRLLLSGSGPWTTVFLRFTSSRISNKHGSIIRSENFFNFTFGLFINEFLIESDNSLTNSLTDSINLGSISTSSDSNSNIKIGESLGTQKKDGLHNLTSHGLNSKIYLRLDSIDWTTIDSQKSFSMTHGGNCNSSYLFSKTLD